MPPLIPAVRTDADGRFELTLPNGRWTLIPGFAAGEAHFEPAIRIVETAGAAIVALDFSGSLQTRSTRTVAGTITYAGAHRGRVYVTLRGLAADTPEGGRVPSQWGTSLPAPGPFQIRGVAPGEYVLVAYQEHIESGELHAASPQSAEIPVSLTHDDAHGLLVPLVDPGPVAPGPLTRVDVIPVDRGAVLCVLGPKVHGVEAAETFNVYWATTPDVGPGRTSGGGERHGIFARPGGQETIIMLRDLPNGADLWFSVTSTTAAVEGPVASAVGPVRIGAPRGGTTVHGQVHFDGFVPSGPVVVHVESPRFSSPFFTYWTIIEQPTSPQPFTISGMPPGTYMVIAHVDSDSDGVFWGRDPIVEVRDGLREPFLMLEGGTVVQDVTLSAAATESRTTIRHVLDGAGGRYAAQLEVREIARLPVAVVVESGAGVSGPVDLHGRRHPDRDGRIYQLDLDLGRARPVPGDDYAMTITYVDGGQEHVRLEATPFDSFATLLQPIGRIEGDLTPTFRWTKPSPAVPGYHTFAIRVVAASGAVVWEPPVIAADEMNVTYGDLSEAEPLSTGAEYRWTLDVRDAHGNTAQASAVFIP